MKLTRDQILIYSKKYELKVKGTSDQFIEEELRDWFATRKYLTREKLIRLGYWKSPRPLKRYKHELNTDERVREITKFSLASKDEFIRFMCLQLLKGVSWGVASVILHFAYPDQYMIMDYRAIKSLGIKQPKNYNFDFWMEYTTHVRGLAKKLQVTIRELDKALWMHSKEAGESR